VSLCLCIAAHILGLMYSQVMLRWWSTRFSAVDYFMELCLWKKSNKSGWRCNKMDHVGNLGSWRNSSSSMAGGWMRSVDHGIAVHCRSCYLCVYHIDMLSRMTSNILCIHDFRVAIVNCSFGTVMMG